MMCLVCHAGRRCDDFGRVIVALTSRWIPRPFDTRFFSFISQEGGKCRMSRISKYRVSRIKISMLKCFHSPRQDKTMVGEMLFAL